MAFEPNPKILELINKYKTLIGKPNLNNEVFKWLLIQKYQGKPDTTAPDFNDEFLSIEFQNIPDRRSMGSIKLMLISKPEELRKLFINLFDESKPLPDRIRNYMVNSEALYKTIDEKHSSHQDERTIATLLTFKYPEKYTFYKDSIYQEYCRYLGIKSKEVGVKYVHYLELIQELIENYIKPDSGLIEEVRRLLPDEAYSDPNHMLLAQDIIYQTQERDVKMRYWLYSPGNNANMWEEFYSDGIMGIDWVKLGDLNNYNTKKEMEAKLKEIKDTTDSMRNDATANWDFKTNMKLGDVVIVKKGISTLLGFGIVESDYYFAPERDNYRQCRKVKWMKKGEWTTGHRLVLKTLTDISKFAPYNNSYDAYYSELLGEMEVYEIDKRIIIEQPKKKENPLNIILFGPPGTGKTYNTVNKALEIIGVDIQGKKREEIKKLFDEKMKECQIVFTTFHQSMSYEDFIEGIKPNLVDDVGNETEQLSYKIEDGIIKRICVKAKHNIYKANIDEPTGNSMSRDELFNKAYEEFLEHVRESIEKPTIFTVYTKTHSELEIVKISNNLNLELRHTSSDIDITYIVSKQRLLRLFLAYTNIDAIKKVSEDIKKIIGGANYTSYWAVLNVLYDTADSISKQKPSVKQSNVLIDYDTMKTSVEDFSITKSIWDSVSAKKQSKLSNFVLIIDEINRGNVAQIFGELITLIEEDKRLGKDEALEVTLPYSKEKFGVPPNLYIIGTMNTADRSIEALDTALRRRFDFEETPPLYSIIGDDGNDLIDKEIEGINLSKLLKTINIRIEKLLDKDHLIGHSYFIKVNSIKSLKSAFENEIIPLLQEYFYGDFGKIGLVLGEGFVELDKNKVDFAKVSYEYDNIEDIKERPVYKIKAHDSSEEFKAALLQLM